MPRRVSTATSSSPKSSPTIPTTRTWVKKLAASEKCVAEPPSIRSRSPKGVATESNATEPTTTTDMPAVSCHTRWEDFFLGGTIQSAAPTLRRYPNGRSTVWQVHRVLRSQRGGRTGRAHDPLGANPRGGSHRRDGLAREGRDPDDEPPRQGG